MHQTLNMKASQLGILTIVWPIAIEDNIKSKNETYTDATEHENNYHHKNDKSKNDKNYETDNHKNNKNYKNDDDAKNYETDKNENNRMDWSVFDMVLSWSEKSIGIPSVV